MLKNRQSKIILIFFIIGILVIGGFGWYCINSLDAINNLITSNQVSQIGQVTNQINQLTSETKIMLIISCVVFFIIGITIAIYLSRFVIYPINKLIKASNKISEEDIKKGKRSKKDTLGLMTTELKDKLSEKKKKKNQIETILLHMTDGIIAFNRQGEIILINPAAKKLLSIGPEDNNFEDIFKKFNLNINMEKIIYLENWTSTEQRIPVEDKYAKVIFAPFKNENERPDGVIAVIQDITEHVKLDNMQKELVADVSHELKTPITSIMGYADTLLEGEYDKETQDKFLNVIATEARRMAKLVTDLLTLSRYDNNKKITQKETFDLGDLVKKCQDKLAIEAKKKNHNVNCFVTADVPPVYADKYDIERVVLNILSNSIKYTKEGGEIKIYVGFVYNDAYIKVFDNGIGIP